MHARHLLLLALTAFLTTPVWATHNPFVLPPRHTPTPPQTLQPTIPAPPMANVQQAEAVQVYTLPDGRYHAEIAYLDAQNTQQKYSFEGTQAEIQQNIQQSKQIPPPQKQALLQALAGNDPVNLNAFTQSFQQGLQGQGIDPKLFQDPAQFMQQFFNDPAFKNDPFNDPSFKQFMQNDAFMQRWLNDFWQNAQPLKVPPNLMPSIPKPSAPAAKSAPVPTPKSHAAQPNSSHDSQSTWEFI